MKKIFSLMILSLLVLSMGTASAKTLINGKIYNADYSDFIVGADVTVTCNGYVQTAVSNSAGDYTVTYENENDCGYHDPAHALSVYAEKGGLSGYKEGTINDEVFGDWDLAVVNVPLVPEFGFFVGVLTLFGAVGVFFFIRRE